MPNSEVSAECHALPPHEQERLQHIGTLATQCHKSTGGHGFGQRRTKSLQQKAERRSLFQAALADHSSG
eukprot:6274903-Alexandrium_andersonii.AAC.1